MVLLVVAIMATAFAWSTATVLAIAYETCLARSTRDMGSTDESTQGQELVLVDTLSTSAEGGSDTNGSSVEAPLAVIRFLCGRQVGIDSLQSAFCLYATAAVQCSPAQLRALYLVAEKVLRYQGGVVSVRGVCSNATNSCSMKIGGTVVGRSVASVPGTAACTGNTDVPLRTFSMAPLRLRTVDLATVDGDGRMVACQSRQTLSIWSASDIVAGDPCEQYSSISTTEAPPRPVGSTNASAATSRGRTMTRQPYTRSRGRRRRSHSRFRSLSPVRLGGAVTFRSGLPREEPSAAAVAQDGESDAPKVTAADKEETSTTSTATLGIAFVSTSASPVIAPGGQEKFKTVGSCHDGDEGSDNGGLGDEESRALPLLATSTSCAREEDGAPPATSRGRSMPGKHAHTGSGGHHQWTPSGSPPPVRLDEAAAYMFCDEACWVTATADWKVTDTAEAIAAATSQSTPPLTPVTTCSASSTRSTTSESSNFKASSESYCDSNDSNDSIDEENDPRKDNEVGDPSLLDGDDGSVVETATEVVPRVTGFGLSPPPDGDGGDGEDDDTPAGGYYITATGPDMELFESEGENTDGGFGDVFFVTDKKTRREFAFKTSKNTAGGRRQMEREVQVLRKVGGKVFNIVEVQETRCQPMAMLLMRKEPGTLSSMLKDAPNSIPREIVKVLYGALTAVGELYDKFGLLHRDLKPDNILVDEHGNGKLTDFGMCVKAQEASRPENVGDGTPAYSAPETSTPRGASVASEIYAIAVIFIEGLMNNCPFGSEELAEAATDRLNDLEGKREDLVDKIEFEQELEDGKEEGEEGEEGEEDDGGDTCEKSAEEELELVRTKEHRLGVVSEDGWEPDDAARAVLTEMGPPLRLFVVQSEEDTRSKEKRGEEARKEAQANPRKLFEDNWVEWFTTFSKAACDEGLLQAVDLVLDRGMLDPDPESRPQTAQAARDVLVGALTVYEAAEGAGW